MDNKEIIIKMAINGWNSQITATNNVINKLSDKQLLLEVAPHKNRGIYLLGHLTSVHDLMLPLLRLEESLYPELKSIFVDMPDKAVNNLPDILQLKSQWNMVNEKLMNHFTTLSFEDWISRHASISDEDFKKEPYRNRLNVLFTRTNHLSYHYGQLVLLK